LAIEHLAQLGRMVSLSLNGLDLIARDPSSIYSCHLGTTTNCANLS
jgi:hypothetical protein